MAATQAAYNFWLYELCDVYIVSIYPVTLACLIAESLLIQMYGTVTGSNEAND